MPRAKVGEGLGRLREEIEEAAGALQTKASEILELAERLEHLTQGTPVWHAATRARVEARAALLQAEVLRGVLDELASGWVNMGKGKGRGPTGSRPERLAQWAYLS